MGRKLPISVHFLRVHLREDSPRVRWLFKRRYPQSSIRSSKRKTKYLPCGVFVLGNSLMMRYNKPALIPTPTSLKPYTVRSRETSPLMRRLRTVYGFNDVGVGI